MPELVRIQQPSTSLKKRLRVAAYARVSMECETLKHSLAAQISHFSEYIQSNPDWVFAGIYADDFVSGTSTKHRDEFNRMMADCDAGRIDLILVKSISRFARDTVDALESIRHLKRLGIAVSFEREKINSLTDEGELMLTLLASFAQAESESISQNVKWGIRKRFAQGIPCGHKAPFGYQWDGEMFRILPERADAIKEIYSRYLGGESAYSIAKLMAAKGVKGQAGKLIEQNAVKEILSNRAYTGTVYLQKYFLSEKHKRNVNHGELPMYAVDGLFEPFISEADFEAVQDIRAKRAAAVPKAEITAFSGIIRCGNCGAPVSRRNQEGKKRWVCSTRERKGMKACDCRPIMEQELMKLTASVLKDDEGISATNTKHREGFKKMVDDALNGKIDLIVTKSVSRFARNTVDSLSTIRKLKEKGVEVFFEKENIWTLDAKGELLITIMSSLAQEESRSISENTTWGKRKQFSDGKVTLGYSTFLGYDADFKINEEQAKTVRLIYKLYLSGYSAAYIARELEHRNIKAPAGGDHWSICTITSILGNEKYKGDALLQKNFTIDYLEKKSKKNEGEVPQYYVTNHHEAIISPEIFDIVQMERERQKAREYRRNASILSGKIKCGCCGAWFGLKTYHSNDRYRKIVYKCGKRFVRGVPPCESGYFTEDQIKEIFVKALNKLVEEKQEVITNLKELTATVCDTERLKTERDILNLEVERLAEQYNSGVFRNAREAQNQDEYKNKEAALEKAYREKLEKVNSVNAAINEKDYKRNMINRFIAQLEKVNDAVTEFDSELWCGLLDHIRIDKEITVVFKGGTEIKV